MSKWNTTPEDFREYLEAPMWITQRVSLSDYVEAKRFEESIVGAALVHGKNSEKCSLAATATPTRLMVGTNEIKTRVD